MVMLRGQFDTPGVSDATERLMDTGLFNDDQLRCFKTWARELSGGLIGTSIAKAAIIVGCSETTISSYAQDGKIETHPDEGWARFVPVDSIIAAKQIYDKNKGGRK